MPIEDDYTSLRARLTQSQIDIANQQRAYNDIRGNDPLRNSNSFSHQGLSLGSISGSMIGSFSPLDRAFYGDNVISRYENYITGEQKTEEQKNAVGVKVLEKIKKSAHSFVADEAAGDIAASKADEYRALGLTKIADVVEAKATKLMRELAISLAGYKRINRSELDAFQQELAAVSDSRSKRRLIETPLAYYVGQGIDEGAMVKEKELAVPPAEVLEKLKVARGAKLFDDYSVLHIQYVPDPILCGRIAESSDLYFIAEWGDDVKLTDIVK